ncbi:Uncharacterised protein [Actinomyces bovis]|uniref:Uncharacterized protein n=1 Tax=Actinomyces bovis TaxID=1658 RepID=A0ABY1VRA5_9ACTO|nr:hypothetical protein [Actinomyces bovis]SPT55051.1 Uncharacterised protein [Actinomyces bovis]VEG56217.1 Uncharacterised protein [Actinomyces israelii]
MTSTSRRNAGPLAAIAVIAVVAILAVVATMSGVFSSKAAGPESPKQSTAPQAGAADGVEAVEPDLVVESMDENVPNDQYFKHQWDLTSANFGMNATNA